MHGEGCFMKTNIGSYSGDFKYSLRGGYGVYEYVMEPEMRRIDRQPYARQRL
jgi:hypothetical protein